MKLEDARPSYTGPAIDDAALLEILPRPLRSLLEARNGFILYGGGLHLRGACTEPAWHSLRAAWLGEAGVNRRFPVLRDEDVPFAQSCTGDQFVLRDHDVLRLQAETGELELLGFSLGGFLWKVEFEPLEFLRLDLLLHFEESGHALEPGELLRVETFPPTGLGTGAPGTGGPGSAGLESGDLKMRAVSCAEQLSMLAEQLAGSAQ